MNELLQRGSRGELVRELQQILKDFFYYTGEIDGIYGPLTEEAVVAFQQDAGIQVDGIVGPQTRAAIEEQLGRSVGGSAPGLPPIPSPGDPVQPEPSPGAPRPGQAGMTTGQAVGVAAAIAAAGLILPALTSGSNDE
jgi:peptidoglycan hydrolase-like protein with peptidoglycan-binding domain